MMGAVEPALQLQQRNFVSNRQDQGLLRPTLSPSNAVIHKRVKSLESCFQELASSPCPLAPHSGFESSNQDAAAQVQVQELKKELDRTKLVYGEIMLAQDEEIMRLRSLLNNLGVDGDGNPLPTGAEAADGVY